MKHASKKIVRSTRESAEKAADAHIAKMQAKGWGVAQVFAGNAGFYYKYIVEMTK